MDFEKIRLTNIRVHPMFLPLKRGSFFDADMMIDGKVVGIVRTFSPTFNVSMIANAFRWVWFVLSKRVNQTDFFWSRVEEAIKTESIKIIGSTPNIPGIQLTATVSGPEPRDEETEPPRPAAPPVKKKLKLTKIHSTGAYQVLIEGKPFEVRDAGNGEWIVSDETRKDVASRKSLDECRDFLESISGPKLDRDFGGFYTSVVNGTKYYIQNLNTNYWSVQTNHREIFQGDTLTQCREFLKKIAAGEVTIPEESDKKAS